MKAIMRVDKRIFLYGLLVIATIAPLWLLPIAPLVDWPVHLGLSREAYLLLTHQVENPYYYVYGWFVGYTLVHALLVALQFVVSIELAGKLVLSLLFIITPLCWWAFLRLLAPGREEWLVLGLLINYSDFFYAGNINYLFALNFGLVWLAIGIKAFRDSRPRPVLFGALGLLVFMAHGYVFFMLGAILALVWAYERLWKARPADVATLLVLVLLMSGGLINTLLNPNLERDYSYFQSISVCVSQQIAAASERGLRFSSLMASDYLTGLYVRIQQFNPLSSFGQIFSLNIMAGMLGLAALGYLANAIRAALETGRPMNKSFGFIHAIAGKFDCYYLALAGLFLLHFALVPSEMQFIAGFSNRSLPFAMAFVLLALRPDSLNPLIRQLALGLVIALVVVNIGYQLMIFEQHGPVQKMVLDKLDNISAQLPDNSVVLVIPSAWTETPITGQVLQAHYNAVLLMLNPRVYVSGLFVYQDTFLLRSSFPAYDDFVAYGPFPDWIQKKYPNATAWNCYQPVPKYYSYYIDENMTLHKNNNAALNQSPQ